MWCSASNFSAVFAAAFVSVILSANLTDIALMLISGLIFLSRDKTRVESTPPLRAIDTFPSWNFSNFCCM